MDSKRKLSHLTKILRDVDQNDDKKTDGGTVNQYKLINAKLNTGEKQSWEKSMTMYHRRKMIRSNYDVNGLFEFQFKLLRLKRINYLHGRIPS